jgi:hypothetical protein
MKYKSLIMATHWKPNIKIWWFLLIFPPSLLVIENLQNHCIFKFLISNLSFWWNFTNKENAAMYQHRFSSEQCFQNHLYHGWKFHSCSLCGWEEGHPDSHYIWLCPISGSRLLVHCGLWLGTGSITLNLIQSRVHDEYSSTQPTHQMSFHMPDRGIHFTPSIFCIGNVLKPTWMHLFKYLHQPNSQFQPMTSPFISLLLVWPVLLTQV